MAVRGVGEEEKYLRVPSKTSVGGKSKVRRRKKGEGEEEEERREGEGLEAEAEWGRFRS